MEPFFCFEDFGRWRKERKHIPVLLVTKSKRLFICIFVQDVERVEQQTDDRRSSGSCYPVLSSISMKHVCLVMDCLLSLCSPLIYSFKNLPAPARGLIPTPAVGSLMGHKSEPLNPHLDSVQKAHSLQETGGGCC